MAAIISILIGFVSAFLFAYILYWLDRYEKEPLPLLLGVFIFGAVVSAGASFLVNTTLGIGIFMFTGSEAATDLATGSLIAPLVEEVTKGLAVLLVFLIFRREFDSVLDGIIYAGVAALGFAATENAYYIYAYGYEEAGWDGLLYLAFIRVILVGWQHPFYTAFTGIGLAMARMSRNGAVKFFAPLGGLVLAMFTHGFHNTLATLMGGPSGLVFGTIIDWSGWLFMFIIIVVVTRRERKYLREYLGGELQAGTIPPALYHTAASSWKQIKARLTAMFNGKYRKTVRFYQVCGEYAHKRHQYATLGNEKDNVAILQKLRVEMAALAPYAQA